MARRIPGEFVPLDLNMPSDPKIRRAGPDAELLYIRGLIYLKRTGSDGFIPEYDLAVVAAGCKNPKPATAALIKSALWVSAEQEGVCGWNVPAWLKWNMSQQEIADVRLEKKTGALKTNHGKGLHAGRPAPGCPECEAIAAA